jgi:hypothetical protein
VSLASTLRMARYRTLRDCRPGLAGVFADYRRLCHSERAALCKHYRQLSIVRYRRFSSPPAPRSEKSLDSGPLCYLSSTNLPVIVNLTYLTMKVRSLLFIFRLLHWWLLLSEDWAAFGPV